MGAATILGYRVLVDPEDDGSVVVRVPAFPGCEVNGETLEDARARARHLIQLHLQILLVQRRPVPPRDVPLVPRCSICGTTEGEILGFGPEETRDEHDFECRPCWASDADVDTVDGP